MPITPAVLLACSLLAQPAAASQPATPPAAPAPAPGPYHIIKTIDIGGDGRWDLLAVDPAAHRLYIPRGDRIMVIDTETGKPAGEVAGTAGVHGVALAPGLNKGFSSNGKAGTVSVFDLKTLKIVQTVKAGENPDAILFDASTGTILCFNGRSKDVTVINAADGTVTGTIPVGGKPELAAVDGTGKVYVNIEDTSEVIRLDPKALKVEARFPLAPGESPTGLALDPARHRLIAACGNSKAVVLDAGTGKILATPAIGKGVDGAEFDPSGFALTSNGEGTLSVISTKDDRFEVVQTLTTLPRARTLAIDPIAHRVYLPSAEFEAAKEPAKDAPKGAPRARPAMKPGSFKITVVGT